MPMLEINIYVMEVCAVPYFIKSTDGQGTVNVLHIVIFVR